MERMTEIHAQLQQAFAEGLHEAGENYRTGGQKNTASEGGVKYAYNKPAYERWEVEAALDDVWREKGTRNNNIVKIAALPSYVTNLIGIKGDMYIHRDHAYENMATEEEAQQQGRYREGKNYHGHGPIKMADAIMALENPVMAIAGKGNKYGNPVLTLILEEKGNNGSLLYATLGFYSGEGINGKFNVRPHLVLTIAERDMQKENTSEGRDSYEEVIRKAVENGRIIDFDQKKRDLLSVIAKQSRLGNVSANTLNKNLTQFKKEIKDFQTEKKIKYSARYQQNEAAAQHLQQENSRMTEEIASLTPLVQALRKMNGGKMRTAYLAEAVAHLKKIAGARGNSAELGALRTLKKILSRFCVCLCTLVDFSEVSAKADVK